MAREDDLPRQESEEEEGGPVKSFLEHLEDLRWTIIKSGAAVLVGMTVCLIASPALVGFLNRPITDSGIKVSLEVFNPVGGFMISLKLGFYGGFALAFPFVLYFVGQFVLPALKAKEKKYFMRAFTIGTGFFVIGLVVCYFFILPLSLRGLTKFNEWLGLTANLWRAEEYYEFVIKFALGVGLIFEVPVVILTLVRLNVIKYQTLAKGRRYMFVFNFILCAILTPADLVTTILLAIALQIGYEICLLIARVWEHQRERREAESSLADSQTHPSSAD